jgi:hypothetical protein
MLDQAQGELVGILVLVGVKAASASSLGEVIDVLGCLVDVTGYVVRALFSGWLVYIGG